ncbi:hypothetical protein DH2020_048287 [Rehmannia glutinosa]|uniref:Aldose 1-epimerase n=1 Tax=Rehmannia glutinosa TaxID=99300 RepID=A0ABR0U6V4_REHGL
MAKALSYFSLLIISFTYFNVCKADEKIGIYELKNGHISINITNYGATVLNVLVPDRNGKLDDIVLGFGSIDGYKNDSTFFGALVGRVANRIGGAQFTLNGHVYKLPANDHGNTLHDISSSPGIHHLIILDDESHDIERGTTLAVYDPLVGRYAKQWPKLTNRLHIREWSREIPPLKDSKSKMWALEATHHL